MLASYGRVCAVFGGTYMLGRPIASITPPTAEHPASLTFERSETYTADCLVRRRQATAGTGRAVHRALIVLDKRVHLELAAIASSDDAEEEETAQAAAVQPQAAESALFVLPPGCLGEQQPAQPIFALMAGEGTFSAPAGQCGSSELRSPM